METTGMVGVIQGLYWGYIIYASNGQSNGNKMETGGIQRLLPLLAGNAGVVNLMELLYNWGLHKDHKDPSLHSA